MTPNRDIIPARHWRLRSPAATAARWVGLAAVAAVTLAAFRLSTAEQNWGFLLEVRTVSWWGVALPTPGFVAVAADLLDRALPPDVSMVGELAWPVWETINIATLGTLLGVILATPIALLAARNTTPHPLCRGAAILVIVASRSVHSLIWAMLLVIIVGPGPLAGTLAIGLRSVGFIAKLLYEALEEIDRAPVTAVQATGATPAQVIVYGVAPQLLPTWVSVLMFRWDINIRESTVIGLVGAGGIGLALDAAVNYIRWDAVATILMTIFVLVLGAEWLSAYLRQRLT